MKRCPQCQQIFSDDNFFCLSDGTPLPSPFDAPDEVTFVRNITEEPTLVRHTIEEPTFVRNTTEEATLVKNVPFVPQIPQTEQTARQGVSPAFAYAAVGLLALLVISGAGILFLLLKPDASETKNSSVPKNDFANTFSNFPESNSIKPTPTIDSDEANRRKANLDEQQASLEKEKQRLADERRKLDELKNKPDNTSTYKPADPPTARISFQRGASQATVSGAVSSQRSYVLSARSGQYLSASVNSYRGCVTFSNGSSAPSYTTGSGDNRVTVVNRCGGQSRFSLTVSIR